MDIDILSLFPNYFAGPFEQSILKRAKEKGLLTIRSMNIRDYSEDKFRRVDDRPYGGGPGMVLMAEPVVKAIRSVRRPESTVIYLSAQGTPLNAKQCQELSSKSHLILLCGHYEGIDERILKSAVDLEISIGDYVLTSGAPAALVLIDAVARFIPDVIGDERAAIEDSFQNGMFDCPHYTRPVDFEGEKVPEVLLQGNHKQISEWRKEQGLAKTKKVRPDLYLEAINEAERLTPNQATVDALTAVALPVWKKEESIKFYKKTVGIENHGPHPECFLIGPTSIRLVEGEPCKDMVFRIAREPNEFLKLIQRLRGCKDVLQMLRINNGCVSFQDPNGYTWVFEDSSKGD